MPRLALIEQSRTAWALRKAAPKPPMKRLIAMILVVVVCYLLLSLKLHPSGDGPSYNFSSERGSITVLSAVLLASAGAWAFGAFLLAPWREKRYRLFWLVAACAMAFLSIDELLEFHERAGGALYHKTSLSVLVDQVGMRNLNDFIVIMYGVVAIPVAIAFLPGLLQVPRVLELLVIAFLFYVMHTVIDSISEPPTPTSVILEESAKLMTSCFISLAMLSGMLGTIAQAKAGPSEGQDTNT